MNILLAVDGSESCAKVASQLVHHAEAFAQTPHVHLPIPLGFATKHVAPDVVEGYYKDEGQAITQPVFDRLLKGGLVATSHVRVGSPGETIALAEEELDCSVIWMGTHGRGTVTQALLGSVAARVVSLAIVPVTLVR